MGSLAGHWTNASINDFLYRIGFDYIGQIQQAMETENVSQAALAKTLNISEGRVSQILNSPGNLTLRNIVEYARALGKKVAIVAYDDHDPDNHNGPINSRVFEQCWRDAGKPSDFFEISESPVASSTTAIDVGVMLRKLPGRETHYIISSPRQANTEFRSTPEDFSETGSTKHYQKELLYGRA